MIIAQKIKKGDTIMVIAPSRSLSIIGSRIDLALQKWNNYGINVVFSEHCKEIDEFDSSTITSRIDDLHNAFENKEIDAIFTAIGGYNSNQLLKYVDYNLISLNPKILCGFSDISALSNAIYTKTGLITYSGLHFSTWSMKKEFEYNLEYFEKCLVNNVPYDIVPSLTWSDDEWFLDQENRNILKNEGFRTINNGESNGIIIGGHLRCINALQGTEYMPSLKNSILFLEDDEEIIPSLFDRGLQSIIHLPEFKYVQGIVIGRFQKKSHMSKDILTKIIKAKKELNNIPIIANVDFGHTNPLITFPIGGTAQLKIKNNKISLKIIKH